MISHELRTPLNAINGFSEVIAQELYGPIAEPRYRNYAEDIHASGKHLLHLIEGILNVSRMQQHLVVPKVQPVSARRLVMDIAETAEREALLRGNIFEFQRVDEARLDVDPELFQQATLNVVQNAFQFSPPGGYVGLKALMVPETGQYRIEVTDEGPGIPADKIAQVTEPFYQVEGGLNRRHEGSGIGLYLAKSFIKWVSSI